MISKRLVFLEAELTDFYFQAYADEVNVTNFICGIGQTCDAGQVSYTSRSITAATWNSLPIQWDAEAL
jgi:hypothetical protein